MINFRYPQGGKPRSLSCLQRGQGYLVENKITEATLSSARRQNQKVDRPTTHGRAHTGQAVLLGGRLIVRAELSDSKCRLRSSLPFRPTACHPLASGRGLNIRHAILAMTPSV